MRRQRGERNLLQRFCHQTGPRRTTLWIFFQQLRNQLVQRSRHIGAQHAHARSGLQQHFGKDAHQVLGNKRRLPGQALKQHAAQRVQIRATIQLAHTAHLLGGHVLWCADDGSGASGVMPRARTRNAKVEHFKTLHPGTRQPSRWGTQ